MYGSFQNHQNHLFSKGPGWPSGHASTVGPALGLPGVCLEKEGKSIWDRIYSFKKKYRYFIWTKKWFALHLSP
jgi:hypothetical protein